jgi:hypothetical protein
MNIYRDQKESGQVLMILMVGLVALLAFTALAIDGGMYFSDRRYDQNAADASSFAGAGAAAMKMEELGITYENFGCAGGNMQTTLGVSVTAAVQRAASNNFAIATDLDNQHGVVAVCGIEDVGGYLDKYVDVKVMVTTDVQTAFAHMFFGGQLRNTVEAVARVRPRTALGFGFAVASLSVDCQGGEGGVEFDGDASVTVNSTGNGVFSNSCMEKNGGVDVNVVPSVYYSTDYADNGTSGGIFPAPQQSSSGIPQWTIPAPDCNDPSLIDGGNVGNGGDIQPGRYTNIRTENRDLNMAPGLYCIISGNFKAIGGTISVDSENEAEGVTIYLTNGDFSVAGNVTVNLRAPMIESPPAIKGVLIYLAEDNTGVVTIQGDATSSYRGTIFAPDGSIYVGGGSSTMSSLSSQIIANTVKIHGTTSLAVEYDGGEIYSRPSYLTLQK